MAKIKLRKMTFAKYLAENGDQTADIMVMMLTGKTVKEHLEGKGNEEEIWIDTDNVFAVTEPEIAKETGDSVFAIMFKYPCSVSDKIWFNAEDYDRFFKAWSKNE